MGVCESPQHGSGAMLQINLNVVLVRQCANLPNKMKVKIIFDRHTHYFFLGENGKNTLCLFQICHHHHMYSVTEPNTCCSKWSENVTFSHRFAVFSTWGVAHRGLWTTSQWSPMPLPTANRSTRHPGRSKMGGRREHVNIDTTTCDPIISMSKEKIGLKMRVFPQKNRKDRPFDSKGPNLA